MLLDPLGLPDLDLNGPARPPRPVLPTRKLLRPSPDHPDDYILELDYSSISKYLECPRSFENYLVRSRESEREPVATSFGQLFHSCEELRLEHGLTPAIRQRQTELVADHFLRNPVPPEEYRNSSRMLDVLSLYNERYGQDSWPERIHIHEGHKLVERSFKIPLCTIPVNGYVPYKREALIAKQLGVSGELFIRSIHVLYTGRIDAVLRDSNYLFVIDHKTSSRGGREFEEAFNLSLQTRGYCWAAHELGIPVSGLIMNAVIVRPLTKTGTGTEFNRHTYFYDAWSLAEWRLNMVDHVSDMVNSLIRGSFPQTARSFKSPCSGCDYQLNCQLPPSQRSGDLASGSYHDVTWDPTHHE